MTSVDLKRVVKNSLFRHPACNMFWKKELWASCSSTARCALFKMLDSLVERFNIKSKPCTARRWRPGWPFGSIHFTNHLPHFIQTSRTWRLRKGWDHGCFRPYSKNTSTFCPNMFLSLASKWWWHFVNWSILIYIFSQLCGQGQGFQCPSYPFHAPLLLGKAPSQVDNH